jgi:hypothetical protein
VQTLAEGERLLIELLRSERLSEGEWRSNAK